MFGHREPTTIDSVIAALLALKAKGATHVVQQAPDGPYLEAVHVAEGYVSHAYHRGSKDDGILTAFIT